MCEGIIDNLCEKTTLNLVEVLPASSVKALYVDSTKDMLTLCVYDISCAVLIKLIVYCKLRRRRSIGCCKFPGDEER